MIEFDRDILFLDLETTGVDIETDRIVEMAFVKVDVSTGERVVKSRLINPGVPIPDSAAAIHGITDEKVKDAPTFKQIAKSLFTAMIGCDLAGFNSNRFDFPVLRNEFERVGIKWDYKQHRFHDVGNLFKIMERRNLAAAVQFYCGKKLEGAHGAEADILATVDVFNAMLDKYQTPFYQAEEVPDWTNRFTPTNPEELMIFMNHGNKMADLSGKLYYDSEGELRYNFGNKTKDVRVKDDLGFARWMQGKGFPFDTMELIEPFLYAR